MIIFVVLALVGGVLMDAAGPYPEHRTMGRTVQAVIVLGAAVNGGPW
ncbi:hypothetical protein AB0N20_27510 [Streptomyces griseoincarnatus]